MAEEHHIVPAGTSKPLNQFGLMTRSGAEAFGAFILVLGGVSISMFGGQAGIPGALGFGFLFIAGIIAVGHVSGGHFNPALTLGFAVAGRLSWKDVLPYIIAQVIGGAAAMGLLWVVLSGGPDQIVEQIEVLFGSVSSGYGQSSPSQFPMTSVLLLEVILTAVLTGVYLGATSSRAEKALAPFAAGLTYAAVIQVALPISGGGLNPARSTATVLFGEASAAGQLWLFWVAPLAGAAIAGLIARSIEMPPAAPVHAGDSDTGHATTAGTTGAGTTGAAGTAGAGTIEAGTSTEQAGTTGRVPGSTAGAAPVGGPIVQDRSGSPAGREDPERNDPDQNDPDRNDPDRNEDDARDFFDGKGGK